MNLKPIELLNEDGKEDVELFDVSHHVNGKRMRWETELEAGEHWGEILGHVEEEAAREKGGDQLIYEEEMRRPEREREAARGAAEVEERE